ncbi:MAG: DUF3237 domain-containing protein [Gammaproteobacteria bacterium]
MRLEPLMTYSAALKAPVDIGIGPYGQRTIFEVSGGTFEGARLKGRILTGGGDWLLFDPDGVGHLDVRATFQTDDGAAIYVQYFGRVMATEAFNRALQGHGETDYGEVHFFTQPRFETGDQRYKWLNSVIAIGQGRVRHGQVEYQVFQCAG